MDDPMTIQASMNGLGRQVKKISEAFEASERAAGRLSQMGRTDEAHQSGYYMDISLSPINGSFKLRSDDAAFSDKAVRKRILADIAELMREYFREEMKAAYEQTLKEAKALADWSADD